VHPAIHRSQSRRSAGRDTRACLPAGVFRRPFVADTPLASLRAGLLSEGYATRIGRTSAARILGQRMVSSHAQRHNGEDPALRAYRRRGAAVAAPHRRTSDGRRAFLWLPCARGSRGRSRRPSIPVAAPVGRPMLAGSRVDGPVGADSKAPKGTSCPSTGASAIAIARDRRPTAGSVADALAVLGPVSRDRPGDCSPVRFDSECRPLQARFRIHVRTGSHKGLVHQLAGRPRTSPPNEGWQGGLWISLTPAACWFTQIACVRAEPEHDAAIVSSDLSLPEAAPACHHRG
jgi:hypothetical protein